MECVSYAVYQAGTGTVVHVHTELVGLGSSEAEILQQVDPRLERDLRVLKMSAEGERPSGPMRVVDGQLSPAEDDAPHAGAVVVVGASEPEQAERQYTQEPPPAP
jgi:hypothetical protein